MKTKKILLILIFNLLLHNIIKSATETNLSQEPINIINDGYYLLPQLNYSISNSSLINSATYTYTTITSFQKHIFNNQITNIKYLIEKIGITKIEKIINKAIKKELNFYKTHFVFYHAQRREFRIIQDLYTKLYEYFHKQKLNNFLFIRIPNRNFDQFKNISNFLNYHKNDTSYRYFDSRSNISKHILAVNVSLLGNSISSISKYISECTFKYFVRSTNISNPNILQLIQEVLKHFGLNQNKIIFFNQKIRDLIQLLTQNENQKTGNLLQIFIPINLINSICYRSKPGGRPFYKKQIQSNLPSIVLQNYTTELLEKSKIKNNFLNNLNPTQNTGQNNTIKKLRKLDKMQFRILITNDIMLNPESKIKIFRYTNKTKNLQIYKEKLDNFVKELILTIENN